MRSQFQERKQDEYTAVHVWVWELETAVTDDQIGEKQKIEIDHSSSPPNSSVSPQMALDPLQHVEKASR